MPAKQLEFNTEARARLKRGVDQLAEAVKVTLRSEEHTSELQSQSNLVCPLLLEKKRELRRTRAASAAPPPFGAATVLGRLRRMASSPLSPRGSMPNRAMSFAPSL